MSVHGVSRLRPPDSNPSSVACGKSARGEVLWTSDLYAVTCRACRDVLRREDVSLRIDDVIDSLLKEPPRKP